VYLNNKSSRNVDETMAMGSWAVHRVHPLLNLVDGADVHKASPLQVLGEMALESFMDEFLGRGLRQGPQERTALENYLQIHQMWPLEPWVTLYRLTVIPFCSLGDKHREEHWFVCRINDRLFAVGQPSDLVAESILYKCLRGKSPTQRAWQHPELWGVSKTHLGLS
jgi:hypothetical protein